MCEQARTQTEKDPYRIRDGVLLGYDSDRGDGPIRIPSGVRVIGESAFARCLCPQNLDIPEGVEVIDRNAFFGCRGLTRISFPASLRTVGPCAFYGCFGLREVGFQEGAVCLDRYAFSHCRQLERVTFPSTLRIMADRAFFSCASLRQVILPAGVTRLGEYTFKDVPLESLQAPGLAVWTDFGLTPKVTRLTLPSLPVSALPKKYKLAAMSGFAEWENRGGKTDPAIRRSWLDSLRSRAARLPPEFLERPPILSLVLREQMLSRESAELFLQKAQKAGQTDAAAMLLDWLGRCPRLEPELETERMLRELTTGEMDMARFRANWRFMRTSDGSLRLLEYLGMDASVSIPAFAEKTPVTELGCGLFRGREDLVSVIVPDGVRIIHAKAFSGCVNLVHVDLPDTVTTMEKLAFQNCGSLQTIRLPAGLTEIPAGCFYSCSSLAEIAIPDGVQYIRQEAFFSCTDLAAISIPDSLRTVGENAFRFCDALRVLHGSGATDSMAPLNVTGSGLTQLLIPSLDPRKVQVDWDRNSLQAFRWVPRVLFPAQVRSAAWNTFQDFVCLKSWDADPDNPWLYTDGPYLISRQEKILLLATPYLGGDAVLPEGITEIRTHAFYWRQGLRSVTIPATVRVIRKDAFTFCLNLRTVRFLGTPREVSRNAFRNCPVREDLVLPEGSRWV